MEELAKAIRWLHSGKRYVFSDIAAMLKLSVPRVKQLLNDLYARLGVANRAEAAATIQREHLIG